MSVLKDTKAGEIDLNFDDDFYSLLKVLLFTSVWDINHLIYGPFSEPYFKLLSEGVKLDF